MGENAPPPLARRRRIQSRGADPASHSHTTRSATRRAKTGRRPTPRVRRETASEVRRRREKRRPSPVSRLGRRELELLSRDLSWSREVEPRPPAVPATAARRLHIVMVGWEFPPNHTGGLGVHVFELASELTRMGHRITFLSPFSGPFTPVPGVTFRWPGAPPPAPSAPQTAPEATGDAEWSYDFPIDPGRPQVEAMVDYNGWVGGLVSLTEVDVIHVHDWFGTVGAAKLARRLGRPLVMTMHSTEYDRSLGHPWPEILDREQYGVDAADRVIAVSRHLKAQLVDRYHARADKVRVVYNAVRPPERLARLQSPEPVVLYLGRLAAMKGVDTFLRAGARVLRQVPNVLLVVAGEGPEYPHLLTLAAHLGIADRVLFLGKVHEEERTALLARASVFVLPSVVEPFGIAALEAMAAGVPTIVSKTSGVAEVARDVFAVDFWDIDEFASRIAELLEYPALRATMGERGRTDATREGWTERALETAGVYAELLTGPGGRA